MDNLSSANQLASSQATNPPTGQLIAQRLTTASAVVDALGGTKEVAALLGVGASSVSNYRRSGFPARSFFMLSKTCEARRLDVADAVFGGFSQQSAQHPAQGMAQQQGQRSAASAGQARMLEVFTARGYKPCQTAILQPAGPFIDRMGEEMRRRLYIFTDPRGEQLCLRPDLTIPTALDYLANYSANGRMDKAKYAYEGLAFRYQLRKAGKPEEFYQAGIEILGANTEDAIADEADVLQTILQAVERAGIRDYHVTLNHLGMFSRFLECLDLGAADMQRLERAYHQSTRFEAVLNNMVKEAGSSPVQPPVQPLTMHAETEVAGRSVAEVNARLAHLQQAAVAGLSPAQVAKIRAYMNMAGPVPEVMDALDRLVGGSTMDDFNAYWTQLVEAAGLNQKSVRLGVAQGRKMAYYTGFAFEIHVPELGPQRVIASGGRYDDLLQSLGAPGPLTAIGGALALERVVRAADLQRG